MDKGFNTYLAFFCLMLVPGSFGTRSVHMVSHEKFCFTQISAIHS